MSNAVGLAMLKSLIGEDQLAQMEQLSHALMKALVTIDEMNARLKRIEDALNDDEDASGISDAMEN